MRRIHVKSFILLTAAILGVGGCGSSTYKVTGTVKQGGQPLSGALVVFLLPDGTGYQGSGLTDSNGQFTLTTSLEKSGSIKAGTYKVMVTKADTSKVVMPKGTEDMGKAMAASTGVDKKKSGGPPKGPAMGPAMGKAPNLTTPNLLNPKYSKAELTPIEITVPSKDPIEINIDK